MKLDLQSIKNKQLPRLTPAAIFEGTESLSEADSKVLAEYFRAFTNVEGKCPGCGATLGGGLSEFLTGGATFIWGIAHGEGTCRKCGYPCRALHYDIGPIKTLPLILPYHPDELSFENEQ